MSEWYRFGPKINRALWIIMERSKRPLRLTAAKLFTVSLETFTSVSGNGFVSKYLINSFDFRF